MIPLLRGFDWKVRVFRGQAEVSTPKPGTVRVRYSGACVIQHATAVTALLDQWIDEGRDVRVIVDGLDLECVAPAFSRHWRTWLERNRERLTAFEVLALTRFDAFTLTPAAARAASLAA
jgi:hypothetical protein